MIRITFRLMCIALIGTFSSTKAWGYDCPNAEAIIQLGKESNTEKLEILRNRCLVSATGSYQFVIYLASYMAEPNKFGTEFARAFPVETEGWRDISTVPEFHFSSINSEFYFAGALASVATKGNRVGIEKLAKVASEAGGAWAEILFRGVINCLLEFPGATLSALTELEATKRVRLLELAISLQLNDDEAERFIASIEMSRVDAPFLVDEITGITSKNPALRKQ